MMSSYSVKTKMNLADSLKKLVIPTVVSLVVGLTGYHLWNAGEVLQREKFGQELRSARCSENRSDDFQIQSGNRIYLISKLRPSSNNIFFLQTVCDIDEPGDSNLSSEQACSIYSAAVQNPSKNVILLNTCQLKTEDLFNSSTVMGKLLDLPNFFFVNQNISKLIDGVFKELVPNSTFHYPFDDEAIRFLVIYKFGGTYINMDLINLRSLDNVGVNFIAAESNHSIGNYFFNFEPKHGFLKRLLLMYYATERITLRLITSVLRTFCRLEERYEFVGHHEFAKHKLRVLAKTLLYGSFAMKNTSDETNIEHNGILIKNPLNPQNQTNETTNHHCAAIYESNDDRNSIDTKFTGIEGSQLLGTIKQAEDYFTFRMLFPSFNNIYFMETSCSENHTSDFQKLSARQACAIYSTAFHNPSRDIILIYTCIGFANPSSGLVKKLLELPNFSLAIINLTDFVYHALQNLAKALGKSRFPSQHNADLLRLIFLYLYGGTYMDMDIISLRSLDDLGRNFIGSETDQSIANGILSFDAEHMFTKECLREAKGTFTPTMWHSIGSSLPLSVLFNHCGLQMKALQNWSDWRPFEKIRHMEACNVTVLPKRTFYAIPYWDWMMFYDESDWPTVQMKLQQSYVAYFWNHKGFIPVNINSEQPYAILANQHCQPIIEHVTHTGQYFLE